jgi:hypothetical protein
MPLLPQFVGTIPKRGEQSIGIRHAKAGELCQGVGPLHLADGCRRRRDELDGQVTKHAAEARSSHGLPQFMAVIDNCSTVANDTQTRYGPWATATQR